MEEMEEIYKIEVVETLARVVEVKATSLEEAIDKVQEDYDNQKIVLDYSDYLEVNYNALDLNNNIIERL